MRERIIGGLWTHRLVDFDSQNTLPYCYRNVTVITFFRKQDSLLYILDTHDKKTYYATTRRGVEQLAARRAHNPEAAGSSPAPAKL